MTLQPPFNRSEDLIEAVAVDVAGDGSEGKWEGIKKNKYSVFPLNQANTIQCKCESNIYLR